MPLANLLVHLAYRQQASARYAGLKGFFHKLLTDPRSHRRKLYDSFMIVLLLSSVTLLIYEVRHPLGLLFPLLGTALDVGEQKGKDAGIHV